MKRPLADRMRPKTIEDVVGQQHLLSHGKILAKILERGEIPNMIFYGPSGTGKTTVANIVANITQKRFYKLNATNCSVGDIKAIVEELDSLLTQNGVLLYLDEIQNFNKKQQQSLLEYIENGKITLIASTTENPYFYVYNAILSRCTVLEFKTVQPEDIETAVRRAAELLKCEDYPDYTLTITDDAVQHLAISASGDVRRALNALEVCVLAAIDGDSKTIEITKEIAEMASGRNSLQYDRSGDSHYDILSAVQKSIRGSDENAALHYLARALEGGDLPSICRRLLVIASEDIGLAYPLAAVVTKSCVDSALQLGMPEARIPLAEAVVLLATAPKSNSSYMGINRAIADVQAGKSGPIPRCLQNKHFDSAEVEKKGQFYQYPHDFPNHWVAQQYLPDNLKNTVYYQPGNNKFEQNCLQYWEQIKKTKK